MSTTPLSAVASTPTSGTACVHHAAKQVKQVKRVKRVKLVKLVKIIKLVKMGMLFGVPYSSTPARVDIDHQGRSQLVKMVKMIRMIKRADMVPVEKQGSNGSAVGTDETYPSSLPHFLALPHFLFLHLALAPPPSVPGTP